MRVPRRVCAIAAPVLAAGLLAGCASTVAGTARFAGLGSDGATVSAAQLDGLFPDAGAVADLARTGPLGAPRTYSSPPAATAGPDSPSCTAAVLPGAGYPGSQTDVRGQSLTETSGKNPGTVEMMVVRFDTDTDATSFVDGLWSSWGQCGGELVRFAGDDGNWVLGAPRIAYGARTVGRAREGGQGFGCARAVGVRGNLVADVTDCGADRSVVADRAARLVEAILDSA